MKTISQRCPDCGQNLVDIGGMGGEPVIICHNPSCPSEYKHVKCPKCQSVNKKTRVLGIGHQQFTCKNCGNTWESI